MRSEGNLPGGRRKVVWSVERAKSARSWWSVEKRQERQFRVEQARRLSLPRATPLPRPRPPSVQLSFQGQMPMVDPRRIGKARISKRGGGFM